MRGRALLVLAVAALLGLGVPAVSPQGARAVACPDSGAVTFAQLWRLWRADAQRGDGGGSGDWAAARRCFGSEPFTVRAYVGDVDGIGGTSMTGVRPAYWEWPGLLLVGTSRTGRYGLSTGPYLGIVVPRGWGDLQRTYRHAWVDVTVRFRHPLARECRGYGPKKWGRPTKAEAVRYCRQQPVILSIARAARTPETDAAFMPLHAGRLQAVPAGAPAPAPLVPSLFLATGIAGGLAAWRRIGRRPRGSAASALGVQRRACDRPPAASRGAEVWP